MRTQSPDRYDCIRISTPSSILVHWRSVVAGGSNMHLPVQVLLGGKNTQSDADSFCAELGIVVPLS